MARNKVHRPQKAKQRQQRVNGPKNGSWTRDDVLGPQRKVFEIGLHCLKEVYGTDTEDREAQLAKCSDFIGAMKRFRKDGYGFLCGDIYPFTHENNGSSRGGFYIGDLIYRKKPRSSVPKVYLAQDCVRLVVPPYFDGDDVSEFTYIRHGSEEFRVKPGSIRRKA